MTLSARKIGILIRLVKAESPIAIEVFSGDLKVSRSTVYRDIKRISEWLEKHHLQPVYHARNEGFYLDSREKRLIKERVGRVALGSEYHRSPRERRAWIGVLLLTRENPVFLPVLVDKLNVSRSTILRDLETLKEKLGRHRLSLRLEKNEGYHIVGAEQDKRRSLVHFLARIHPDKETHWLDLTMVFETKDGQTWYNKLFSTPDGAVIYRILFESERYLEIHYPDDVIEILSIHLLFLLRRYRQGKMMNMDPMEKVILKPSAEYQAAQYIGIRIAEEFELSIPDDELCYISVCLMEARNEEYCPSSAGEEELEILRMLIEKMVVDFERDFHLNFRDRDILERSLFFHLKSAYYRIVHGLEVKNPLAGTIISHYPELFKETKKVIHHLEQAIGKKVSDDEIALVTMHFGGWLEKLA